MNRSLLIVEDDPDQLEALVCWFSRAGYDVTGVDHPGKAREAAGLRQFHVALLDISLPDMDGLVLMQRLHLLQYGIQVIILSGHDNLERRAKADGAFACLAKPCRMALLRATVEDALERAADEATPMEQPVGTELLTVTT